MDSMYVIDLGGARLLVSLISRLLFYFSFSPWFPRFIL